MDMSRLTTAHKIGLGGAVVLLVASFLPWYSVGGFGIRINISGWDAGFLAWFGSLVGLAGGVVLGLKAFGTRDVRGGGFAAEQIALLLGAASLILIILRLITESSAVAYGLFLGLVGAAAVAFGSFRAMTEAGMSVDDMKRQMGGARGPGEPPPPGPGTGGPPMTPPGP
jgi:hypothetical protein